MADPTGMAQARDVVERAITVELSRTLVETADQLQGPVREAANRLVVAARRGRRDLADECRDQLALAVTERQLSVRSGMSEAFTAFFERGIGLLFDGLVGGLRVAGGRR
jgi:hypothetical protein